MTVLIAGGKKGSETMKRKILTAAVVAVMSAGLAVAPRPGIVTPQALAASSTDQSSASDDWVSSDEGAAPEQEPVSQDQSSVEIDNGNSAAIAGSAASRASSNESDERSAPAHSDNRALDTPESNHRKYFKHLKDALDKSQRKNQEIFEKVERNIRANPPSKPWNPFPPADGASH